jgi:hypothetical protein
MAERLAVDVTVTRETMILGKRWDDTYPVTGTKISRIEFKKDIGGIVGRGDAFPADTQLPDVTVHCWLDLQSKLTYSLKVWVED